MRLIVNGDDFGISHACNLAIMDCYHEGIMRSASMMTNMPAAEEAAALWKINPGLSVGLHFSLTAGRPISKVKKLVKEDGTFNKAILRTPSLADPAEIRQELRAQFERFVELNGKYPDHLNSHHGIEVIPEGAQLIQEYSRKYHLPIRRFLNKAEGDEEYQVDYQVPVLRMMTTIGGKTPVTPEAVIASFSSEDLTGDNIFELVGHPGYVDCQLLALSSLTESRCYDAYTFCNSHLKEWIKSRGIQLITYRDIPLKKNSCQTVR